MRIGSLFSGIGGLELGLEMAGAGPVLWQAESDQSCLKVLARHWPEAKRYEDVRAVDDKAEDVDILCGGPPCQDLSDAGTAHLRMGLGGSRSGLASEMLRVARVKRPRWIVWENVDGNAWWKWVPVVRPELLRIGYSSLSVRLRAADVGAPFLGSRVFLVAKADSEGQPACAIDEALEKVSKLARSCRNSWGGPSSRAVGVADGIPHRVVKDRLRMLGNAVVPLCAKVIGMLIMSEEAGQ